MSIRRIILYTIAFITIVLYGLVCNDKFRIFFYTFFQSEKVAESLRYDKYIYGDLYGLSYLKEFKQPVNGYYTDDRVCQSSEKKIELWAIGDSYLGYIFSHKPEKVDSFLCNTHLNYFYWYWQSDKPYLVSFNKQKKNILLIEQNERFVRNMFGDKINADLFKKYYVTEETVKARTFKQNVIAAIKYKIVPGYIEQVFESVLLGYDFLSPIKQAKAAFNNNCFERILSSEVYLSKNKQNLFVKGTVTTTTNQSSFNDVSSAELDDIVKNMNGVANHYRKLGFDKIIWCITPSAVTIVGEGEMKYNNLIPRIQSHPQLAMQVVDIYSILQSANNPSDLYWRNDSHWNSEGFRLWVDALNKKLKKF